MIAIFKTLIITIRSTWREGACNYHNTCTWVPSKYEFKLAQFPYKESAWSISGLCDSINCICIRINYWLVQCLYNTENTTVMYTVGIHCCVCIIQTTHYWGCSTEAMHTHQRKLTARFIMYLCARATCTCQIMIYHRTWIWLVCMASVLQGGSYNLLYT